MRPDALPWDFYGCSIIKIPSSLSCIISGRRVVVELPKVVDCHVGLSSLVGMLSSPIFCSAAEVVVMHEAVTNIFHSHIYRSRLYCFSIVVSSCELFFQNNNRIIRRYWKQLWRLKEDEALCRIRGEVGQSFSCRLYKENSPTLPNYPILRLNGTLATLLLSLSSSFSFLSLSSSSFSSPPSSVTQPSSPASSGLTAMA